MRVNACHHHGTAREGRGSGSQRSGARRSNLKGLSPRLLLQVPSRLELSCGPCAELSDSGARLCAASGPVGATRLPPAPWRKPRAPGPRAGPAAPRRRGGGSGARGQAQPERRHHQWGPTAPGHSQAGPSGLPIMMPRPSSVSLGRSAPSVCGQAGKWAGRMDPSLAARGIRVSIGLILPSLQDKGHPSVSSMRSRKRLVRCLADASGLQVGTRPLTTSLR
jgi:hypothetical protein